MRIVFAGTPDFAAVALDALIAAAPGAGWTVALVLSQPDRPAGRGLKLAPSPVKALAQRHGIAVATPPTLSVRRGGAAAEAAQAQLRAAAPDLLVVAAYGLILPQSVLDIPRGLPQADGARLTALNIHASLLPRWRGAAPVARAIEAGDATTGITIMQMEAGLDTGPMLMSAWLPIDPRATAGQLTADLAALGALQIVQALQAAAAGTLRSQPQPQGDDPRISYAHKLLKEEAWLDWRRPAAELARRIRAFDPYPVACGTLGGTVIRLWRGEAVAATAAAAPGTVLAADAQGIVVAAGEHALRVAELQRAGGKRLAAREFLAGWPIAVGDRFVAPPARDDRG